MAESPISELEKLQIKLKQTESLAKLGTWEFDLVSDKISWSDGVFHILGYVPQSFEVSFERAIEITHPEDREKSILLLQACVQAGEEYNIEKRFISRTGETKYILSRAETVRDASGKVVKLIGVYQDITEPKKTGISPGGNCEYGPDWELGTKSGTGRTSKYVLVSHDQKTSGGRRFIYPYFN